MNNHPNMTEQELLNDLLNQEKQLMSSGAAYIQEASCHNLRKLLANQFMQTSHDQYQVFDLMREKGYYPIKDASSEEVQQIKNQFKAVANQLK